MQLQRQRDFISAIMRVGRTGGNSQKQTQHRVPGHRGGRIITVNTETAAALDLDYSAFNDLAGTVVEVETTAE